MNVYDHAAIDPYDEVKPRLNRKPQVCVPQNLEAECAAVFRLARRSAVEPRYETVDSAEHGVGEFYTGRKKLISFDLLFVTESAVCFNVWPAVDVFPASTLPGLSSSGLQ
jgi:hypothetical protein